MTFTELTDFIITRLHAWPALQLKQDKKYNKLSRQIRWRLSGTKQFKVVVWMCCMMIGYFLNMTWETVQCRRSLKGKLRSPKLISVLIAYNRYLLLYHSTTGLQFCGTCTRRLLVLASWILETSLIMLLVGLRVSGAQKTLLIWWWIKLCFSSNSTTVRFETNNRANYITSD